MRIIAASDIHGRGSLFFDIVEMHIDDADIFISLGDCNNGNDLDNAKLYFGKRLLLKEVCGNCDFSSTEPAEDLITVSGKRVLFCHGHLYVVKHGYSMLFERAKEKGADIALFGHTHTPFYEYRDNIHLFNPGSVANSEYGIIDITPSGIMCINAKL